MRIHLFLAVLSLPLASLAADHPNIIFIMADDVGYGDLGCYGAKLVKTPNLDRLAAEGCRFANAHSPASTCTPSRRAFLTGAYSWRQEPGSRVAAGDASLTIEQGTTTAASLLERAGYRTGLVGKWHVGLGPAGGPDWNGEIKPGPLELGFDYAFFMAATADRVPTVYVENHRVAGLDPADPITVSYTEKTGDWPTGAENPDQLAVRFTHGHDNTIVNGVSRIGWMTGGRSALWKDEDMADTFTGKAMDFVTKNKDRPFFLFFATSNIHVPRVPHPRFHGASAAGNRSDAIQELDEAVGYLLGRLDQLKLTDKTLVIFTSDNGGVLDDGYADTGRTDYNPNAPLRGTKGTLFEGGHRVPFLARWPGRIPAGITSDALISLVDMPATFAAIVGEKIPAGQCPDSINELPALTGQSKTGRPDFVAHIGGTKGPFSLQSGSWKYITPGASQYSAAARAQAENGGQPQLYDLASDPAEQNNLAPARPEIVEEMQKQLAKIRGE